MPAPNAAPADLAGAHAEYLARVVHPAFFDRLAERGYRPATEKQAAMYLHMGDDLAARQAGAAEKAASDRSALVNDAYAAYCRHVGVAPVVDPGADPRAEKAAADRAADPAALSAALDLIRAYAAEGGPAA